MRIPIEYVSTVEQSGHQTELFACLPGEHVAVVGLPIAVEADEIALSDEGFRRRATHQGKMLFIRVEGQSSDGRGGLPDPVRPCAAQERQQPGQEAGEIRPPQEQGGIRIPQHGGEIAQE